MEAQELVQKIDNSELSVSTVNNIHGEISGVGILSNTKNKFYGTGFVIDDYTLLTNNHVVEENFGIVNKAQYRPEQPQNLKFMPSRDANNIPYSFTIKDVTMIKGVDVAILHTNEKLTDKVEPLKLAKESDIEALKFGDKLSSYGYPNKAYLPGDFQDNPRYKMYNSNGFYMLKAKTEDPQFYSKMIIRMGASGSPILNEHHEVVGINPGGMNNKNSNATIRGKNEMAYVFELSGYVREQIEQQSY
ncbi:hypothetical protein TP70_00275 [Staphylococcus microti]|uniref:Serine protease n=1 Tax=Staphylococcus microti TaxID=569857 RepID=A0A0D6XSF3_9STAP|nr:serine protease [Staphylococcus microti]KIX91754.1 hypothetical protein TP70_00275 [Staphylococcus microti]PNZ77079.1 serine protease [Staphylococcus microti]SUM58316.1 serine protease [Staphylococcus microti]